MLYLSKRLLVIPMPDQYEQVCNSIALKRMGVQIVDKINKDFTSALQRWLNHSVPVEVDFPSHSQKLVKLALGII